MLSYDQAPPVSVPLRFLVTAPAFGVACGVLLAVDPDATALAPLAGTTLAAVHLYTAGFMLLAMMGAMMQILPVTAGAIVPRPLLVARVSHGGATLGAAMLAAAMASGIPVLFDGAVAVLAVGACVFLSGVIPALLSRRASSPTLTAIRLATAGLAVTLALGFVLALALAGQLPTRLLAILPRHGSWGLAGWGLMLVMGVAFVVVPMFEMTPPVSRRIQSAAPWVVLACLFAASVLGTGRAAATSLAPAGAIVAIAGWRQFDRRKRRPSRDGTPFWRLASAALLAGALTSVAAAWSAVEGLTWLAGVLLLHGFFGSLIVAMSYRIVPFLLWLHAQTRQLAGKRSLRPVPSSAFRMQLGLHAGALALLAAAPWAPTLRSGGVVLAASHLWMVWVQGGRAWRHYRRLATERA